MSAAPDPVERVASAVPRLRVDRLGSVPYRDALAIQERAMAEVRAGGVDRLLLLEHPSVITLGRSSDAAHLLESEEGLSARGISVESVARGGDVTYHGPGQLVGYLICSLRNRGEVDVHRFVRDLEDALIEAIAALGVETTTVEGRTGVFVEPEVGAPTRKIASIGIGVRHWITWHGFALNVDVDLSGFDAIVPCGLADVEMTSLAKEGAGVDLAERARTAVSRSFARRFGRTESRGIAAGS